MNSKKRIPLYSSNMAYSVRHLLMSRQRLQMYRLPIQIHFNVNSPCIKVLSHNLFFGYFRHWQTRFRCTLKKRTLRITNTFWYFWLVIPRCVCMTQEAVLVSSSNPAMLQFIWTQFCASQLPCGVLQHLLFGRIIKTTCALRNNIWRLCSENASWSW